jgi:hypothetical protein
MKKKTLQKIEKLLLDLPEKDRKLSAKYLEERKFKDILEIVESDIYKANKAKQSKDVNIDNYIATLIELREEISPYVVDDITSDDFDYII